ncbi:MAG: peptidyl-prolyl cis-trans isomerase [Oscillospiraceae bacterium]|nr:peptidyl-prolyl cis-trans isomerase [Oscillospiraceae bacterium]
MSASREKKQRQNAGPDQKALKAQQERAARKQKTIVYSIVGAVAAVLVIALLVWRTGFFQARSAAATVGDETLSTAQLSYYYYNIRSNFFANSYSAYLLGFDNTKSDDEQVYDPTTGQTYRDYFVEQALINARFAYALEQEALNAGHTEAEVKDDVAATIANAKSAASSNGVSYSAYLRLMFGPYMSAGVFERELTRALMADLVNDEKYDALYDSYAQADLENYYKENADSLDTIEYSYLYFAAPEVKTTDEDGIALGDDEIQKLKDDAKAEAKEKAEEALEAVKDGSTFASQAEKYELTSSGDHIAAIGTNSVASAYREQLLKLGKDECDLVEVDGGYYVVSFHDRYLADEPTRDVRHILVRAETTTDENGNVVAPTEEAWAAAKAKMDEIQAAWEASGKTEDDFAKLANEKSDDVGSNTNGGLYERSYDGRFVSEFNDWVFDSSRKSGDVGMVQHNQEGDSYYGYHLIYYVGENEPVWMGTARNSLANTARSEWRDGIFANYPTAELGGAKYLGK